MAKQTQTITLRVEQDLADHLRLYCEGVGVSINKYCQDAIAYKLSKETVTDSIVTVSPNYRIEVIYQPALGVYSKATLVYVPNSTAQVIMTEFPEAFLPKVVNKLNEQIPLLENIRTGG